MKKNFFSKFYLIFLFKRNIFVFEKKFLLINWGIVEEFDDDWVIVGCIVVCWDFLEFLIDFLYCVVFIYVFFYELNGRFNCNNCKVIFIINFIENIF